MFLQKMLQEYKGYIRDIHIRDIHACKWAFKGEILWMMKP